MRSAQADLVRGGQVSAVELAGAAITWAEALNPRLSLLTLFGISGQLEAARPWADRLPPVFAARAPV